MDEQRFVIEQEHRYSRHDLIPWWVQQKIAVSKIFVAGVGAIGNEVLKNLALMGFGHLTIVDFDEVSLSNLTRSVLFREEDQGQSKVEAAKRRLLELNPDLQITRSRGIYNLMWV
ncbi:MAG: ThiF family adenylyltransferase [Synechococcaceae cyanobacterium RL_1_2]|nr:ThiF family adenylyltransferase [Synechococcaceae cyanobacterium RL_1_2]